MDFGINSDPSNLPPSSCKRETLNWLQSAYLVDSNVDSGVVTEAPSIRDYEDENMETDALQHDQLEIRSNHYVPSQSSITSTVLSDMIDDSRRHGNKTGYSTPNSGMSSNIIPAQLFEDKQEPPEVVSELIALLNDEDQVVVSNAVDMVSESARREGSRYAIMSSLECIAAISRIISNGHNIETTKTAVKTLHHLSHHEQGLLSICHSGAINALVKLLSVESVLFYAITTIHNLLLRLDASKVQVRAAGGVEKMVALLRKDNLKFLTVVTDCLHLLTLGHQESKSVMLQCNGPAELVRIVQTYSYEKLLWTATRVLKVLSVCSNNKHAIIAAGGMQALAIRLNYSNNSPRLLQTTLWTLRNLSDAATKVGGLEDLLYSLINLLQTPDEHVVTCTVGILSNLTCNNQSNKLTVLQVGGIEALVQTIRTFANFEEITEPSLCALRHLTWMHSKSEEAQKEIFRINGIPVISNLFQPSSSWPLIKATVGLIRNLAQNHSIHHMLREQKIIEQLVGLLNHAVQMIKTNKRILEGVRMEEIIEVSMSALKTLACDAQNKDIMESLHVVPVITELMVGKGYNANITRVAAELLCEFTQTGPFSYR